MLRLRGGHLVLGHGVGFCPCVHKYGAGASCVSGDCLCVSCPRRVVVVCLSDVESCGLVVFVKSGCICEHELNHVMNK